MKTIEHGLELEQGYTPIDRASLVVEENGELLEVPLTPKQLHAVFVTLGIKIDETTVSMKDDDELTATIEGLEPSWVGVSKAAEMLGVTRGRVYNIIKAGGLVTRDDMGSGVMVSVASIRDRLANPPKAGRRW